MKFLAMLIISVIVFLNLRKVQLQFGDIHVYYIGAIYTVTTVGCVLGLLLTDVIKELRLIKEKLNKQD